MNFFQPVEQLVTKSREGARVHRVYDRAQTPPTQPTVVIYPHGRYELRGDGLHTAYHWVWIPNAPPPPPAAPPAPTAPPSQ